jgi:hypothetical protein
MINMLTDMAYLCLHHATTIYTHLKSFDTQTRRKIFCTMHDSCSTKDPPPSDTPVSKFPSLTQDNCGTLGPSLVMAAVQSLNASRRGGRDEEGWCVDRVWLELQLVLDEWVDVEPSAWYQGVRILLSHFAQNNNWTIHPVFSRLLRRMGTLFQVYSLLLFSPSHLLFSSLRSLLSLICFWQNHLVRATMAILGSQCNVLQQLPASLGSLAIGPYMLAAYTDNSHTVCRKRTEKRLSVSFSSALNLNHSLRSDAHVQTTH